MPLIRIDIPEGISSNIKKEIHTRVREVVLKTLAPKEVKYDYVSIREAFGFIGDGLPVIVEVHVEAVCCSSQPCREGFYPRHEVTISLRTLVAIYQHRDGAVGLVDGKLRRRYVILDVGGEQLCSFLCLFRHHRQRWLRRPPLRPALAPLQLRNAARR